MKLLLILFIMALSFSACGDEKKEVIKLTTTHGEILIWLYDETPKHQENFLKLAKEGFYDGTTFHRVIEGFMIQGGDPNSKDGNPATDGQGGPGYTIPAEFVDHLTHTRGALAAARMGDQVNPNRESSGSQFYIVHGRDGAHFLDKQYTVFGQVISGMDAVDAIATVSKGQADRPIENITMTVEVIEMKLKDIFEKHNFEPQTAPEN